MPKQTPKEKFARAKPHLNVGTIGHAAHGKTTLTAAIVKMQSQASLARPTTYADIAVGGTVIDETRTISIPTAYVEYESPKLHYAHMDCPGLPNYVKNLYDGLAQMNLAILVVSAVDGIQAQTIEHVILARAAGVKQIVVFLNHCDVAADAAFIDLQEQEIRKLLNTWNFDGENAPVIRGAALPALQGDREWQGKISRLLDTIDSYGSTDHIDQNIDKPFMMRVANIYEVRGRGTVVLGRIERGTIKVGEEVELIGVRTPLKTVVTGVEMFRRLLDQGQTGDIASCLLSGVDVKEVSRDQVLALPGSITAHAKFCADVQILKKEQGGRHTPFFNNYRPQFYIATADVTGEITLPEEVKKVVPGDHLSFTVELIAPIALVEGMSFAIREGNHTVGIGVISKILA